MLLWTLVPIRFLRKIDKVDATTAYSELIEKIKETAILRSIYTNLTWDQYVCLPSEGANITSKKLGYIHRLYHEKFTDSRIGELLSMLEESSLVIDPYSDEAANIREIRRQYDKEIKISKELIQELSETRSIATNEWAKAKKESNFKLFLPWLEKLVDIKRRMAEAYGYEDEPYTALLDSFEPGVNAGAISDIFHDLRRFLTGFMYAIENASTEVDGRFLERPCDIEHQKIFSEMVSASIGYDFKSGRIDVSEHPFTMSIGPGDTRITTRYNPNRFSEAVFGTIHETGHALYEMGLDKENHFGEPIGSAISAGVHESQSLMWENIVGRSREFWTYFLPQAKSIFREALGEVSLDQFYRAINRVAPSYIRVEADEVTYNLHIILRFEIERALINGELKPEEVPAMWNSRFKKSIGIEVDDDAKGCLQDIQWSLGQFGYFPTYTLGHLYAAQFFDKAKSDIPNLAEQFEKGEFFHFREWLRKNIHAHGSRYTPAELCEKITGKPLSHHSFVDYITCKFSELYGIQFSGNTVSEH